MDLQLRPLEYAKQATLRTWGDTSHPDVLADLLRAEVTGRWRIVRWAIIQRVAMAASVEAAVVDELCQQLESEGDFTTARGGVLHVTPLRLISLGEASHRVISSLPTNRLAGELPGDIDARGVRRLLRTAEDDLLEESVLRMRGLLLSPEDWVGLAMTPRADNAWLHTLDERFRWAPEKAGSMDRDGTLDWSGLTLMGKGPRFRREAGNARLWRAKSAFGRWLFAWVPARVSPADSDFVSLTQDDANRTAFAVGRVEKRPIAATLVRANSGALLTVDMWLPRPEFRYLATLATPSEGRHNTWAISTSHVDNVAAVLQDQLGIEITEEVGT